MERAVLQFTGAVELVDDEKLPQSFLLDPTRRELIVGREGQGDLPINKSLANHECV